MKKTAVPQSQHSSRIHMAPAQNAGDPLWAQRWQRIVARDAEADGSFYYAVRTTGVYCRPSCAARRPRPENVRFFTTREAAESAGFAPCRRCRPDQAPLVEQQAILVEEACRALAAAEQPLPLAALAQQAGMSACHFHRIFKKAVGLTPAAYGRAVRAARLRETLPRAASVTAGLFDAGYASSSRFYEAATTTLGMAPGRYRTGGNGADIHFALGHCTLGVVLAAESGRGLCAIALGEAAEPLIRDLRARFPQARRLDDDAAFQQRLAQVIAFVDDPRIGLKLPLDIRGTAFQQRVWQALQKIPAGKTQTYSEIAASLGAPQATRAVASACAANTLAVAIPCHRAVRKDGSFTGYRWGVERKKILLKKEKS